MNKHKRFVGFGIASLLCTLAISTNAMAANYKFDFNVTTKIFHGAVYTGYATKYTKTESPVIAITQNSSGVHMQYTVVNDENNARTGTINTNSTGHFVFGNDNTAKGYRYKVRIKTDDGHFWNTYTVKGAWNIDTY
ncbi:MAG TPA: hypothetical protein DCX21_05000 [Eubacterium sp.]|nr:hypothetical protein [Eubacterium sp.]